MRNYISVRQTVVTRWYLNPVTTVSYLFLILLSLTLQAFRIQQEIINIDCQNTIFIIIWLHNIFCNDNFLKRVINLPERSDFLRPLCFIRKRICRLNVTSFLHRAYATPTGCRSARSLCCRQNPLPAACGLPFLPNLFLR